MVRIHILSLNGGSTTVVFFFYDYVVLLVLHVLLLLYAAIGLYVCFPSRAPCSVPLAAQLSRRLSRYPLTSSGVGPPTAGTAAREATQAEPFPLFDPRCSDCRVVFLCYGCVV